MKKTPRKSKAKVMEGEDANADGEVDGSLSPAKGGAGEDDGIF